MGLNCGAQVLYSLHGLKRGDIVDICCGLASEQGMVTPTIDVDCSNVCFKVGKNVQSMANYLIKWANTVLCIVLVCDAKSEQYVSKPQTNTKPTETKTGSKHLLFIKTYNHSAKVHI
jgi:hypothetical protein